MNQYIYSENSDRIYAGDYIRLVDGRLEGCGAFEKYTEPELLRIADHLHEYTVHIRWHQEAI